MDRFGNEYLEEEELELQGQHEGETSEPELGTAHQNIVDEAELLAAQAAAEAAAAEQQQQPGNAFSNVGQGLESTHRDLMIQYWQETIDSIENDEHDFKNHQLPLARIKKVMKTDEDVKMISAEAPILFAKGCDIFITELTMRAWIHAEENKRRTLQKSDIAAALSKSDMFDFLIDIVPREDEKPKKAHGSSSSSSTNNHGNVRNHNSFHDAIHNNPTNDPNAIPTDGIIKSEPGINLNPNTTELEAQNMHLSKTKNNGGPSQDAPYIQGYDQYEEYQ